MVDTRLEEYQENTENVRAAARVEDPPGRVTQRGLQARGGRLYVSFCMLLAQKCCENASGLMYDVI